MRHRVFNSPQVTTPCRRRLHTKTTRALVAFDRRRGMALHASRDAPTARQGSEVLEKSVDCDGDVFWRRQRRGSKPPISGCFLPRCRNGISDLHCRPGRRRQGAPQPFLCNRTRLFEFDAWFGPFRGHSVSLAGGHNARADRLVFEVDPLDKLLTITFCRQIVGFSAGGQACSITVRPRKGPKC